MTLGIYIFVTNRILATQVGWAWAGSAEDANEAVGLDGFVRVGTGIYVRVLARM